MDKEIFEEEKKPQRRERSGLETGMGHKEGIGHESWGYAGETLLTRRLVVPAGVLENEDISWRALEARL